MLPKDKFLRFLLWLAILCGTILAAKFFTENRVFAKAFSILYLLTPALAILLTERKAVKHYAHLFHTKATSYKSVFVCLLATVILFPLITVGLPVLFRESLGVELMWNAKFGALLFLHAIVFGLTINMLVALCGEVAWRGFMMQTLTSGKMQKVAIIGVVWWAWSIMPELTAGQFDVTSVVVSLAFYVACSFLCVSVLQRTATLVGPAMVVGFINTSSFLVILGRIDSSNEFIIGNHGIFAIIAVIVIHLAICLILDGNRKMLHSKS
jgi:membrane protease YdiL (CAAX protease family)